MKQIAYGLSNYKTIRQENNYYVDKTHYIPQLELAGKFLFLIRPRRFGKSSLLTMLECYYDIARADEFEALFADTYIYANPTPEKNAHLILKFNFSEVSSELDKVELSFQEHIETCCFFFGEKYRHLFDDKYFKMMETKKTPHGKLEFLLTYVGTLGLKVYVLIDEYDNFTNTILTTAGQSKYHELTHGAGFLRFFFSVLKGAVDKVDSGISRMFITGVSPVTMDDVTSGFNIGQNISLDSSFNELLGFTEDQVFEMLQYYQNHGVIVADLNETLALLRSWYDNYRFSQHASTSIFNTDMVLYFIKQLMRNKRFPDDMIDPNIKIDYGKLRHLIVIDKRLNGNFSILQTIIETGKTRADIALSFPVENLTKPENFISLLYYFGLLTYHKQAEIIIPNHTVQKLMYSYIREGYEDVNVFNIDLWQFANLIRDMAYEGKWQAVFQFLANEVEKQTTIRDYLSGEKVVQTFLLAYLNVTDYYLTHTENEMGKGFVDLYLQPFFAKYEAVKYAYLIEIKYITRSDFSQALLENNIKDAKNQLQQYRSDSRIIKANKEVNLISIVLVFKGWELVHCESVV